MVKSAESQAAMQGRERVACAAPLEVLHRQPVASRRVANLEVQYTINSRIEALCFYFSKGSLGCAFIRACASIISTLSRV